MVFWSDFYFSFRSLSWYFSLCWHILCLFFVRVILCIPYTVTRLCVCVCVFSELNAGNNVKYSRSFVHLILYHFPYLATPNMCESRKQRRERHSQMSCNGTFICTDEYETLKNREMENCG